MSSAGKSGNANWDQFKAAVEADPVLAHELGDAYLAMLAQLNPSDRGLRFLVGNASEWIIAAAMYQVGILTLPEGHGADGIDLAGVRARFNEVFSVKSSFSRSDFRLTNGMGGSGRGFTEPTLFVAHKLGGIVFGDPALHPSLSAQTKPVKDAVMISQTVVAAHAADHPECLLVLPIPLNPGTGVHDPISDYSRDLLTSGRFPRLSGLFEDVAAARVPDAGLLLALRELRADRDAGHISPEAFERLALGLLDSPA